MQALKSVVAPMVEVSTHVEIPITLIPAPKALPAIRWWMIILAGLVVAFVRCAVILTAMPSFSSREDMDKLWDWQMEEVHNRSPIDGALARIADTSFSDTNGGGHRINLAFCILAGTVFPASYVSLKVFAAFVAAATLMAFLWALRRTIMSTTAVLFAVVFLFPPIRVFTQSGLFNGTHVEAVLFIALMIGFGLRAVEGTTRSRRDVGFAGVGLATSLGMYYSQGMWLWFASFLPALLVGLAITKRPLSEWLTGASAFFLGLLPGAVLIVVAYWPERMDMLLPYQRGVGEYTWVLQKLSPSRIAFMIEEVLLPYRQFNGAGERLLSRAGGSVAWLLLAALAMTRVRRRALHFTVWPALVYIVLFTSVASVTQLDAPRHRMPVAILALFLQCLVLCELAPEFIASFAKRGRKGVTADVARMGALIGFAIVIPRAHEDLALYGRHSLREGLAYDGRVVTALGVDGIEPAYARAVEPRLDEIAAMALSSEERRLVLKGMGLVFSWGEALLTDYSLARSVTGDVSGASMRTQTAAFLAEGQIEEELERDFWGVDGAQEWYLCGVEIAFAALDEADGAQTETTHAPYAQLP